MSDAKQDSGAVRSADADHLDFTSLPLVGLIGVARTASEGKTKYGSHNYMLGFPVHECLNHSMRHIVMFLLGDRTEPHLEHAAWGLLAASQTYTLDPDASKAHLLGPGATVTPAMKARLDSDAPGLAEKRKAGVFAKLGEWTMGGLDEIQTILGQRKPPLKPFKDGEVLYFGSKPADVDDEGFACLPSTKSTGNPAVDAWLNEGGADAKPVFHSHSPLATRRQNAAKYMTFPEMDGETTQSTTGGYFPKPARTESHAPVVQHKSTGNPEMFDQYEKGGLSYKGQPFPNAVDRARVESRGLSIRRDVQQALRDGKIGLLEYNIWDNGGRLPALFFGCNYAPGCRCETCTAFDAGVRE